MSSRAIAPVVGAHHATVARDMESVADATDAPRTVKSIDGVGGTRELVRTGHLSGSPLDPHGLHDLPASEEGRCPITALLTRAAPGSSDEAAEKHRPHTCTGGTEIVSRSACSPRSPLDPHGCSRPRLSVRVVKLSTSPRSSSSSRTGRT